MNRRGIFWALLLLGIGVFSPYLHLLLVAQNYLWATVYSGVFLTYCYVLYHFVHKRAKTKYPIVPPEGRMEAYFPRTDIPRPLHEDVQRFPELFQKKKHKRY